MEPLYLFDYIQPRLAIGGIHSYKEKGLSDFTFLLNVAFEVPQFHKEMISHVEGLVHARLDDTADWASVKDQRSEILRAVALLTEAHARGCTCLVTCYAGFNRSSMVVAEYLIQQGGDPDSVIADIQSKRKNALGNQSFVRWLKRTRKLSK